MEIAIAAPKALEKNEKVITSCVAMVNSAKTALTEALELAQKDPSDDKLQLAYEKNCVVRLHMLDIWSASSVSEVPVQQPLPSAPATVPAANSSPPHPREPAETSQPATPSSNVHRMLLPRLAQRNPRQMMASLSLAARLPRPLPS